MRIPATAALLLLVAACLPACASDDRPADGRRAADVKAAVAILGAGEDAQVALILRGSKRKLIGFVQEAGEDSFQLGDFCTDDVAPVSYDQVESLWGKDAVSGRKVSVGVGFLRKLRGVGDPTRDLHCGGRIVVAPADEAHECCYPTDQPFPDPILGIILIMFFFIGLAGL